MRGDTLNIWNKVTLVHAPCASSIIQMQRGTVSRKEKKVLCYPHLNYPFQKISNVFFGFVSWKIYCVPMGTHNFLVFSVKR